MIDQLILVRHGETVHNAARIAQGWSDSVLSPDGERQVASLAARLASLAPTALYSSPLERAMATARRIAEAAGLEIRVLDELKEMNYGRWEGRQFLDVRREESDHFRRWIADPDCPCPGGESHNDVKRRLERAFEAIRANANGQPERAIAVMHGTAIRIAATILMNLDLSAAPHFAQDNASINVFAWRGERFVLKLWNDTAHCEERRAGA